jgi:hypothetical protein
MNIRSDITGGTQLDQQSQDSSPAVLNVQHALNELAGLKLVPEDGMFGMETSNAILNFQREHQIPRTGQIDEQTINAIQLALNKTPEDLTDSYLNLGEFSGLIMPPIYMISDAYSTSVKRILGQSDMKTSLETILNQTSHNAVAASGAALGYYVFNPILPSLSSYQPLRVSLAQFSSQLEAVMLRNSSLNAPQLIAFAENAVALLRTVLPVIKQLKISVLSGMREFFRELHLTNPSFLPLSGFIKLPGAASLRDSGDILAMLLTGAACRQAPLTQILQSPAFAAILSTFSLATAVPFAGTAASAASFVHSAAFTGAMLIGFMTHIPDLLLKTTLDGSRISELIEALPARWLLLSLTVTTVTMAVMIAVSKTAIEIDHCEAALNLRKAVAASVESENGEAEEAISSLMDQTLTNCDQMMNAVAQATESIGLRAVLHQNGFLPTVDPKIATGLQGIMQRILGTIGKITEDSRKLLLLAEGI